MPSLMILFGFVRGDAMSKAGPRALLGLGFKFGGKGCWGDKRTVFPYFLLNPEKFEGVLGISRDQGLGPYAKNCGFYGLFDILGSKFRVLASEFWA